MKKHPLLFAFLIAAAVIAFGLYRSPMAEEKTDAKTWEYKVITTLPPKDFVFGSEKGAEDFLTNGGKGGWEYCDSFLQDRATYFVYKRLKR